MELKGAWLTGKWAWLPTWEERHLVVGGVTLPRDPEAEAGPGSGRSQAGGEVAELPRPLRNQQAMPILPRPPLCPALRLGRTAPNPAHPTPRPSLVDTQVWLGRGRPSPERHAPSRAEPSTDTLSAERPSPTCGGPMRWLGGGNGHTPGLGGTEGSGGDPLVFWGTPRGLGGGGRSILGGTPVF